MQIGSLGGRWFVYDMTTQSDRNNTFIGRIFNGLKRDLEMIQDNDMDCPICLENLTTVREYAAGFLFFCFSPLFVFGHFGTIATDWGTRLTACNVCWRRCPAVFGYCTAATNSAANATTTGSWLVKVAGLFAHFAASKTFSRQS